MKHTLEPNVWNLPDMQTDLKAIRCGEGIGPSYVGALVGAIVLLSWETGTSKQIIFKAAEWHDFLLFLGKYVSNSFLNSGLSKAVNECPKNGSMKSSLLYEYSIFTN